MPSAVPNFMVVRGDKPGQFFIEEDGQYLTREKFVAKVCSVLRKTGYPAEKCAGHSFSIKAALAAGRCGIQDSLAKTLSHWESRKLLG